jgi:hypothetical protein
MPAMSVCKYAELDGPGVQVTHDAFYYAQVRLIRSRPDLKKLRVLDETGLHPFVDFFHEASMPGLMSLRVALGLIQWFDPTVQLDIRESKPGSLYLGYQLPITWLVPPLCRAFWLTAPGNLDDTIRREQSLHLKESMYEKAYQALAQDNIGKPFGQFPFLSVGHAQQGELAAPAERYQPGTAH